MKRLILVLLVVARVSACAQGIDKLWLMGYACCSPSFNPMNLDWNSGTLNISLSNRQMNILVTNGVASNSNGDLLFYSNGVFVANALDDTMLNGGGLNPSFFTTNHTTYGLTLPQANLVIPFPDDSSKYYLFHNTIDDFDSYASLHLYYSVIDMNLDGGLGAVVQKNTILLTDSLVPGRITASKHANGRDWWVAVHQFHTGMMFEYLVTPNGIQGPFLKSLITTRDISVGQALFSVQGDKFAYHDGIDDLDIWDFDRCSGDFSNQVHVEINDSAYSGGLAFSPSGRYLYVSSERFIYQFDLLSSNIDSSRITVGIYDNFVSGGFAAAFYLAALAPDQKIYINTPNGTFALHTIDYPDSAGLACGFCQHCITLPAYNGITMPNFPNYFLTADGGTVCDSLPTGVGNINSSIEAFSTFPNPVKSDLYINNSAQENVLAIDLINSVGQITEANIRYIQDGRYLKMDLSNYEGGLYFVRIKTNTKVYLQRVVKY